MFFGSLSRRTQAVVTVLAVAVLAVVGLLLLMGQLSTAETSPVIETATIRVEKVAGAPTPALPSLEEAVATVNDQIITQQAWQQATRLDAAMSQLAGQPIPTAEETLDRLINEIIVLKAVSPLLPPQPTQDEEIAARIQALETGWHVTDEAVVAALAEAGLERSHLTARVDRLIQVEAALSQLETQEADLTAWLTQARASAEIGLYHSLVNEDAGTRGGEAATEDANVPSPQPPSSPAPLPSAAPPPEMAVSPYPQNAAPDFTLAQLDGASLTLSSLRGRPTLVNFWATWCPPCRRELPALQAACCPVHKP